MPAYDYRCTSCAHVFEVVRKATDDSPIPCPECGGATKQLFRPVGVHFKGSGFHNTDYRPKAPAESAASEAPSCPSAGSSPSCAGCPSAE